MGSRLAVDDGGSTHARKVEYYQTPLSELGEGSYIIPARGDGNAYGLALHRALFR